MNTKSLSNRPGISRRNLALAFDLPENADKATVLAEIERRHNLAHPSHEREKELAEKSKLIGLNATFSQRCTNLWGMHQSFTKGLRQHLLHSICTLGPQQGRAALVAYRTAEFYLNQLTDSQVLSLGIATLARTSRGGSNLVALGASAGAMKGVFPTRMVVLDWGLNRTLKGNFRVDESTLAVFDANQKQMGHERIALDFEHNTVPGTHEYERSHEPRPVAAYWTPRVVRGVGIELTAPTWTPIGEQSAHNFEDLSAAVLASGETVTGLHSVALCRNGASDFHFLHVPEVAGSLVSMSVRHRAFRA